MNERDGMEREREIDTECDGDRVYEVDRERKRGKDRDFQTLAQGIRVT